MERIAWCITGAGYMLKETLEVLRDLKHRHPGLKITTHLSEAGKEVVDYYNIYSSLETISDGTAYRELLEENQQGSSFFITGRLFKGNYDLLLVSPMTANTVAKVVYGIADSLVSCAVAMACKSRTPVIALPTDTEKKYQTEIPASRGKKGDVWSVSAYSRRIDLENIEKLRDMDGVTVITRPEEFLELFEKKR